MPSTTFFPVPKGKKKPGSPYKGPGVYIPPPVQPGQKPETLDRRIRNIEALDQGVFTGNVLASYMFLPGLVGFWPMSVVQRSSGNVYDLSGQERALTYNGNPTFTYYNGLVPYIDLDGTGDYLSRADETDLDITGAETIYTSGAAGLTMGGWWWLDATGAQALIGKYNGGGWLLSIGGGGGNALAMTSDAGTKTMSTTLSTGAWFFGACRFVPSTSIDVYLNSTKESLTSGVGSSLPNTAHAFTIGMLGDGTSQALNGRAALCFLSSNALGDDLISSLYQQSRVLFGI